MTMNETVKFSEASLIQQLDSRSRDVFQALIDSYVKTGEPVGSRLLSRQVEGNLSPATVRNVMADLQDMGLLFAPHVSAGRLPTDLGLRLFVDGMMKIGRLAESERDEIETHCAAVGRSLGEVLEDATEMLSGLASCASLVQAPKSENRFKHIEFIALGPTRALVVMVGQNGLIENRLIETPPGLPPSVLVEAGNYLNARLAGRSLEEARSSIVADMDAKRAELNHLTQKVVKAGLLAHGGSDANYFIVKGQSKLIEDAHAVQDLEHIRGLLVALEARERITGLLERVAVAEGVQIFIGAENDLFGITGCSVIASPFHGKDHNLIGVIGVVGPLHMNYARLIPMVDYTARLVGRALGAPDSD